MRVAMIQHASPLPPPFYNNGHLVLSAGPAAKLCKMSEGETEENDENDGPCCGVDVRVVHRLCNTTTKLTGVEYEDEQDGQRGLPRPAPRRREH